MILRSLRPLLLFLVSLTIAACAHTPAAPDLNQHNINILDVILQSNVWESMGRHMSLSHRPYPPEQEKLVQWFAHRRGYINSLCRNASPYVYYIYQQTQVRNMPAEIALMPMIESAYDPFRYSPSGATGLWQMMPGTAYGFGLDITWWYDARRDIVASTQAALDYLEYLHRYFHGDWLLAIAAYNGGEGTVNAAIKHNKLLHRPIDFWHLPLPPETKRYVPKLLALSVVIGNPSRYNLTLPSVPNKAYFSAVTLHTQIDIQTASRLAGVDETVIRTLNPGFRRWATAPAKTHQILIPTHQRKRFLRNLAQLPLEKRVEWRHHIVQPGENLIVIAHKYKTKAKILKRVNGLKNNLIHVHDSLLVPMTAHGHFHRMHPNTKNRNIAEEHIPGPKKYIHTVKQGESLWTIARRYGVKHSQLVFWNKVKHSRDVHPGQQLVIWLPRHSYQTTATLAHRVKPGDSLIKIAKHYHVSVDTIRSTNHLKGSFIRVGQVLHLPYRTYRSHKKRGHTGRGTMHIVHVKPGDTLYIIAKRYHVLAKEIAQWNHIPKQGILHLNQRLVIYTG